jgi:hypothetical protein
MLCPTCRHKNEEESQFCTWCGAALALTSIAHRRTSSLCYPRWSESGPESSLLTDTDTISGSGESGCYGDDATQAAIVRPLVRLLGVTQLFQKPSLTGRSPTSTDSPKLVRGLGQAPISTPVLLRRSGDSVFGGESKREHLALPERSRDACDRELLLTSVHAELQAWCPERRL